VVAALSTVGADIVAAGLIGLIGLIGLVAAAGCVGAKILLVCDAAGPAAECAHSRIRQSEPSCA
jgi:hypothetical protein